MNDRIIYALIGPNTNEPKYVGSTWDIQLRLQQHTTEKKSNNPEKHEWIKILKLNGRSPKIKELERCDSRYESEELEEKWIMHFTNKGYVLFNKNNTGKSFTRYQKITVDRETALTIEVMAKISKTNVKDFIRQLVNNAFLKRTA